MRQRALPVYNRKRQQTHLHARAITTQNLEQLGNEDMVKMP